MEARRLKHRRASAPDLPCVALFTDETRTPDVPSLMPRLPRGSFVIFRHYAAPNRAALARAVVRAAKPYGHKVLIAGDWKLALTSGAAGLHIPGNQLTRGQVGQALPTHMLRSAAVHDERAAHAAHKAGVDAVFVSPVYLTRSHPGTHGLGRIGVLRIAKAADQTPTFALGGINAKNAATLRGLPLAGVAAIDGLMP